VLRAFAGVVREGPVGAGEGLAALELVDAVYRGGPVGAGRETR
jgi:hypothetical protein